MRAVVTSATEEEPSPEGAGRPRCLSEGKRELARTMWWDACLCGSDRAAAPVEDEVQADPWKCEAEEE